MRATATPLRRGHRLTSRQRRGAATGRGRAGAGTAHWHAAPSPERTFIETARRPQIVAAAIDTITEAGFARASFARIAGKLGISRGLISYHFVGKDDLAKKVIHQAAERAKAYLAFMRDHRNNVIAMVEIVGSAEGDASSTATLTWSMRSAPSSTYYAAGRTRRLSRDLLAVGASVHDGGELVGRVSRITT